ncbi:MAG: hypothetical protein ACP5QG_06235 [candidate division WOR-3 bacterium]
MIHDLFLCLGLVSKAPPAIITGDVQSIKNFDLIAFSGVICSLDVDRNGKTETFFVSEARGWRDEWIDGQWVAYEVLSKRINKIVGDDTIQVTSYYFSFSTKENTPVFFVSVGFLDVIRDSVMDIAVASWNDEGFSRLVLYDLSGIEGRERPEIAELVPGLKWASYEIVWPLVKAKSPYGTREYVWENGDWVELE